MISTPHLRACGGIVHDSCVHHDRTGVGGRELIEFATRRCGHCVGGSRAEKVMAITLNHTIVPAKDKVAPAAFFARMFGLEVAPAMGHFAPVQVNETLTF